VKLKEVGRVTEDFKIPIELSGQQKSQIIYLPIDVSDPRINELMLLQQNEPVRMSALIGGEATPWREDEVFVYRGQLIGVTGIGTSRIDPAGREEVLLRVKRFVLVRARQSTRLREEVEALERIEDPARTRREAIPTAVKLAVYERDGGACRSCGARSDLQFDHIIPIAKGGGNSEPNVQILCGRCNREKSAQIV
jgi:hypothetical protein